MLALKEWIAHRGKLTMDYIPGVMCGGEIPPGERDAPRSYAAMFSGGRPKVLHASCYAKLRHTGRYGAPWTCAVKNGMDDHLAHEYCPFCFWMFCAEHLCRVSSMRAMSLRRWTVLRGNEVDEHLAHR